MPSLVLWMQFFLPCVVCLFFLGTTAQLCFFFQQFKISQSQFSASVYLRLITDLLLLVTWSYWLAFKSLFGLFTYWSLTFQCYFLDPSQAAQCKDEEEGSKIYYKGKLYSLSSDQPDIVLAREAWTEIINNQYRNQDKEPGSESDSVKVRLEQKGLSRDVLDVIDWWKMKISAGSLAHYGVREGRRRMESKYEWGLEDFR